MTFIVYYANISSQSECKGVCFVHSDITIITAIENIDYLKKVAGNIAQLPDYSMLASAKYFTDIIELCKELSPDILICDLSCSNGQMPSTIREICNRQNCSVKVIATASSKSGELYMSDSIASGAELFMGKLDNPDVLRSTLRIISNHSSSCNKKHYINELTEKVDILLHKLMLPVYFNGYRYLKSAIISMATRDSRLPDISCNLYQEIALEFNTNERHVERALHKAISHINKNNSKNYIIDTILGFNINASMFSFNTKELIALIADQLRLQNYVLD